MLLWSESCGGACSGGDDGEQPVLLCGRLSRYKPYIFSLQCSSLKLELSVVSTCSRLLAWVDMGSDVVCGEGFINGRRS
jgi:hypothetical protein